MQGVLRVVPLWAAFFQAVLCLSFYVVGISLLDNQRNFFYVALCYSTSAYCCLGTAHSRAACLSTIRSGQECWVQSSPGMFLLCCLIVSLVTRSPCLANKVLCTATCSFLWIRKKSCHHVLKKINLLWLCLVASKTSRFMDKVCRVALKKALQSCMMSLLITSCSHFCLKIIAYRNIPSNSPPTWNGEEIRWKYRRGLTVGAQPKVSWKYCGSWARNATTYLPLSVPLNKWTLTIKQHTKICLTITQVVKHDWQ